MGSPRKIRYAMISSELRRDLDSPLRLFERIDVIHFYRRAATNDLTADDFGDHLVRYTGPRDLVAKLRRAAPDIVQGVEPFALVTLPYLAAVGWYLHSRPVPLVTVSLENIPLARKYGRSPAAAVGTLVRRTIARSDLIVAVNEGARQNFLALGVPPGKITRAMYGCWGVDPDEFHPDGPARSLRRGDEMVLIFIGRLVEAKGVFDLLEAFRISASQVDAPLRLVFVGDGPLRAALVERVHKAGLGQAVDVVGAVPNREIPALLRGADLLVVPSRTTRMWAEQVGMVFLQAMACGVPIVTTRSGSIPEFVPDGEVGLLVDEGDIAALAGAITRLATVRVLRAQLSLGARRVAEDRYDIVKNIRHVEDLVVGLGSGASNRSLAVSVGQRRR